MNTQRKVRTSEECRGSANVNDHDDNDDRERLNTTKIDLFQDPKPEIFVVCVGEAQFRLTVSDIV